MMTGGPDPIRRQPMIVPSKDSNDPEDSDNSIALGMLGAFHDAADPPTEFSLPGGSPRLGSRRPARVDR